MVDGEIVWGTKTYSLSEEQASAPAWLQSASPADVQECKIPDPRPRSEQLLYRGVREGGVLGRDPVGFTEWRREGLLPIEGEMNIIFAKIAFEDAPPSPSTVPADYLEEQAKKVTELGKHWSQGKFQYKFQIVEDWVRVPAKHRDYPVSAGDDVDHSPEAYELAKGNMKAVAQLIVENLPADLDFRAADIVVPVWSTNITDFTMPVTWRGGGLKTPNGAATDLIFMGNSTYMHRNLDHTWSILAHDFLHLQGLNEHAPGPQFATHIGGQTTPGRRGMSASMPVWETFLMGWLADSQVHCINSAELENTEQVILTPLETYGGERKTIVIPIADYKALVVESRRATGYSASWPEKNSGLLVYEVDTDRDHLDHGANKCSNSRDDNPKWSYYLLPDGAKEAADCNNPEPYFMQAGEALTFGGVKIELVHSAENADYVAVSKATGVSVAGTSVAVANDSGEDIILSSQNSIASLAPKRRMSNTSHCGCCGCDAFGGGN